MAFVDNTERAFVASSVAIFVDISCKGGNLADASQLHESKSDPINEREVWKALANMPSEFNVGFLNRLRTYPSLTQPFLKQIAGLLPEACRQQLPSL